MALVKRSNRRASELKNNGVQDNARDLWTFYNRLGPETASEFPDVKIEYGDFDEENVVFSTAESISKVERPENFSIRKIGGFINVPYKWRELSVLQILRRLAFSGENLSLTFSVFVHALLVLILVSIVISSHVGTLGFSTSLSVSRDLAESLAFVESASDDSEEETALDALDRAVDFEVENTTEQEADQENNRTFSQDMNFNDGSLTSVETTEVLNPSNLGGGIPFYTKKGVTRGRTSEQRAKSVAGRQGDVTKESEDSVELGLAWLARHQLPDGGWAFDLEEKDSNGRSGACGGKCSNSFATSGGTEYKTGLHPSRTAATAVALLPFLGAGYTHVDESKYQKTVAAGIRFLEYNASESDNYGVDFRVGFQGDGAAYVQALAVLVCCEAYEMTQDSNLKSLAEGGLKRIEDAQLNDGGWRYFFPGDMNYHATVASDSSVLGWQMLALKAGISAGFPVRASVAYRAGDFLDSVMEKNGTMYRYQVQTTEKKAAMWGTTAVGVLVREYLGWEPGNPKLDAGAKQIAQWIDDADLIWQRVKKGARSGKSRSGTIVYYRDNRYIYNLYFAYYAALALHHYGGPLWKSRFAKLRDFLVGTQARGGLLENSCEEGSWLFYDQYMNDGGRLLNTSLAILILETPYRYLPMYR